MRQIFKDSRLQTQFEKDGFIKIQLLSDDIIKDVKCKYSSLGISTDESFSTTFQIDDIELKKKVKKIVSDVVSVPIRQILIDYKPVLYSFLIKKRNGNNFLDLHQDWTFVEEHLGHVSMNIWCPLITTNNLSGNLIVVPGSHRLPKLPRVAPQSEFPYDSYKSILQKHSIEISTRMGDAIIYDSSLFHGSTANSSKEDRLVMGALVIPMEVEPILYFNTVKSNTVGMKIINENYFIENDTSKIIPVDFTSELTYDDVYFEAAIRNLFNEKISLLDCLKSKFGKK